MVLTIIPPSSGNMQLLCYISDCDYSKAWWILPAVNIIFCPDRCGHGFCKKRSRSVRLYKWDHGLTVVSPLSHCLLLLSCSSIFSVLICWSLEESSTIMKNNFFPEPYWCEPKLVKEQWNSHLSAWEMNLNSISFSWVSPFWLIGRCLLLLESC